MTDAATHRGKGAFGASPTLVNASQICEGNNRQTIYLLFESLVLSSTSRLMTADGLSFHFIFFTPWNRRSSSMLPTAVFFGSALVARGSANECIALSGWRGPEPQPRVIQLEFVSQDRQ